MSLPTVAAYPMPQPPTDGLLTWPTDRRRVALLVHDMQSYFLRPLAFTAPPFADLLANTLALRETCHESGIPVLYSVQPGGQAAHERGLLADRWGPGLSADPADTDLPAVLAPRPTDHVIVKRRYSAFHGTPLEDALAELGRDQLLICGVYAHIGVQATAVDAFMRDIKPFVVSDAVAAFSPDQHAMALQYVADWCGRVLSTEQVRTELRAPQPVLAP
ncbi:isochorismatase family protein [Nonomuraea sp. NPDC049400]|uniref:isochorismatase family protein n=1 Tax=Nonomuraea sp. NPDC049400 TaxID=3364352 RepID=UPI0037B695C1